MGVSTNCGDHPFLSLVDEPLCTAMMHILSESLRSWNDCSTRAWLSLDSSPVMGLLLINYNYDYVRYPFCSLAQLASLRRSTVHFASRILGSVLPNLCGQVTDLYHMLEQVNLPKEWEDAVDNLMVSETM